MSSTRVNPIPFLLTGAIVGALLPSPSLAAPGEKPEWTLRAFAETLGGWEHTLLSGNEDSGTLGRGKAAASLDWIPAQDTRVRLDILGEGEWSPSLKYVRQKAGLDVNMGFRKRLRIALAATGSHSEGADDFRDLIRGRGKTRIEFSIVPARVFSDAGYIFTYDEAFRISRNDRQHVGFAGLAYLLLLKPVLLLRVEARAEFLDSSIDDATRQTQSFSALGYLGVGEDLSFSLFGQYRFDTFENADHVYSFLLFARVEVRLYGPAHLIVEYGLMASRGRVPAEDFLQQRFLAGFRIAG